MQLFHVFGACCIFAIVGLLLIALPIKKCNPPSLIDIVYDKRRIADFMYIPGIRILLVDITKLYMRAIVKPQIQRSVRIGNVINLKREQFTFNNYKKSAPYTGDLLSQYVNRFSF